MIRNSKEILSVKAITALVLPFLGAALFYVNAHIHGCNLGGTTKLALLAYSIVFPALLLHASRLSINLKKGEKWLSGIIAFLTSQFLTIGSSIDLSFSTKMCFGSLSSLGIYLTQTLIYSYIAYQLLVVCVSFLQNYRITSSDSKAGALNLKRWFLIIFGVNVLFIFVLYPCVFDFDGGFGLRTYLDPNEVKSNHHPFFVQMIHGYFFNFGSSLGNPSIGFAILTLLFDVCCTSVLVYGLHLLVKLKVKTTWIKAIAILFALSPFYLFVSHYPTKDGFFAIAFLAYCLTLLEIYASDNSCLKSWRFLLVHAISIVLVCLTRNQGLYIVAAESVFLLIWYRKYFFQLLASIAPALVIVILFNNVYLPDRNVQPSSKGEVFGTLFQQTARFLKYYPEDVKSDEVEAISAILPIDEIAEVYEPRLNDRVKGRYGKENAAVRKDSLLHFTGLRVPEESTKLKNYLGAWASMFFRHPGCYIEAELNVIYGYFYNKGQALCILCTDWPESRATTKEYSFSQNVGIMSRVNSLFAYASNLPVISCIGAVPYYIWCFILLMALCFYRKDWKGIILHIPLLLSFAVLLVCPVTDGRYMYPILVYLPFLLIYILKTNNNSKTTAS